MGKPSRPILWEAGNKKLQGKLYLRLAPQKLRSKRITS